jgi:hypothetical protein
MIPPIVIRPSSLPQYPDCQRRTMSKLIPYQIAEWGYQINHTPLGIGAMVGTATHEAAAFMLSEKMRTGEPGSQSEAEDRGIERMKTDRDGQDVNYDLTTPDTSTGQKQVVRMAKRYRADVVPNVQPAGVEQQLEFQTAAGNTVRGTLDLAEDGPIDLKTGTVRRINIAQYGTYSMLLRANGLASHQVREDYLKRVKLKNEQPPVLAVHYNLALAENVSMTIIRDMERAYVKFMENGDPGAFFANPNSVLCGAKFCGCFHTKFCPESASKEAK